MELRHLRYFIAVAEELHFGRAAQVLGISQPPLSQQIQALEQEVGARLFERTNRRVELSEAGRLFLAEARLVLAQVDKAADVARRAQLGQLGELKIGFTSSAPFNSSIPQAIFAFRQAFPAVHLALQEMSSKEVAEALVDESVQVGIMRPLPLPESLVAVELFREPLVAIIRADHPLAVGSEEGLQLSALAAEPTGWVAQHSHRRPDPGNVPGDDRRQRIDGGESLHPGNAAASASAMRRARIVNPSTV